MLARADLVFTGGYSLYEAKRRRHRPCIHSRAASMSRIFYRRAQGLPEPEDQAAIRSRIGYYGVLDERLDRGLLAASPTGGPSGIRAWSAR